MTTFTVIKQEVYHKHNFVQWCTESYGLVSQNRQFKHVYQAYRCLGLPDMVARVP